MSLEKNLHNGKIALAAIASSLCLSTSSVAQMAPRQVRDSSIEIPVNQSTDWLKTIGVISTYTDNNRNNFSSSLQQTTTNNLYFIGRSCFDGTLFLGFFKSDPRELIFESDPKIEKTNYKINYANSRLYIMCPPETSLEWDVQKDAILTPERKIVSPEIPLVENIENSWIKTSEEIMWSLSLSSIQQKTANAFASETKTSYYLDRIINGHKNQTDGAPEKNARLGTSDSNTRGTIQIPIQQKIRRPSIDDYGTGIEVRLNGKTKKVPIRILYHIEIELNDEKTDSTRIIDAFTEEFPAHTTLGK